MSLPRSLVAVCPLAAVLGFSACSVPEADGALASSPIVTQNADGTATKHLCTKTKQGDASKIISGTLLLPDGPQEGELFIDKNGIIACAGATCSSTAGYDLATKISCTDAVISPG